MSQMATLPLEIEAEGEEGPTLRVGIEGRGEWARGQRPCSPLASGIFLCTCVPRPCASIFGNHLMAICRCVLSCRD